MEFKNLFFNPFSRLNEQDNSIPTNDVENNHGSRSRRHSSWRNRSHSSHSSHSSRGQGNTTSRSFAIFGGTILLLSIVGWAWKKTEKKLKKPKRRKRQIFKI
eukprot:GHVP01003244.1.p1 GENE.GHVP01003244.1~~GHVP01003244.1.p1  ORF type:complete len:102 (-),score=14.24 GHVP01003244.1:205-510(-)